ncbi:MAG: GAF domain-containing sensor histidine kinase [Anaerolineales bacterium]|nr:MAG: GAF domain-containing sensor histidine kinase [Anaerolineales bacterium]
MSTRTLRGLAILLPLLFMVGVIYARLTLVPPQYALEGNIFAVVAVALGSTGFSIFFFNIIDRREEEITQRGRQIEALHEAALTLTVELNLQVVLQKVVDISRNLLHAKYGALGVVERGSTTIQQFITSGIDAEARARIGAAPTGHGLLGVLINPEGGALIIKDIRKDPRAIGFPPNHPPMKSLLGVPIKSKGEIFGNLYVADKFVGEDETEVLLNFNEDDRQLLQKFATQAAIAIENAQLYRKTQELTVIQERERFGMALHDGIMQSVYAAGLSLQEAKYEISTNTEHAARRIDQAVDSLGEVLRDLRNYIMGLRTGRFQGQDVATSLGQLATELRANTLMNVVYEAPTKLSVIRLDETRTEELLLIAQEALNNIRKHAQARNVLVSLKGEGDQVVLRIADDGIGFDFETAAGGDGNGLRNMRERARKLGGDLEIDSVSSQGTRLRVQMPLQPAPTNPAGA